MRKKKIQLSASMQYELLGVLFIAVGAISLLALLGFQAGVFGAFLLKTHLYLFGIGAFAVPLVVMLVGMRYVVRHSPLVYSLRFLGIVSFYTALLALIHHFLTVPGREILPESLQGGGGLLGGGFLLLLRKFFGVDGSLVVLLAIVVGSILLSTTWSLATGILRTKKSAAKGIHQAKDTLAATYERLVEPEPEKDVLPVEAKASFYNQERDEPATAPEPMMVVAMKSEVEEKSPRIPSDISGAIDPSVVKASKMDEAACEPLGAIPTSLGGAYQVPSIDRVLNKVIKVKNAKLTREIADKARILEETLDSFHVKAKIVNACNGPAVTRYELEPAAGVKVSKIVNLADDLALKLAAPGVRIEAPIPGKAAVGIEVPNRELSGVHLREVLESSDFMEVKSKLTVGLGMDIAGQAIVADLAKMPHLLVAGATGSGKSVCINTIITSILFKATPEEAKFILIDPKMVELSNYNGIPHLMVPVVTDAKKAASVLNWAVQEMEKRYAMFAASGVRDMERYNRSNEATKMASIVIIIDELADLMMVAANDVEDAICRLAQKARAAGIHLVLATQRPSVDVITGIIKANVPSRISFSVSSQIDSRTILDMSGAEKLLGKGDMLYYPIGAAKPLRVQGAFISDGEVEELLSFIKLQGETEENEEIISFTEQALAQDKHQKNRSQEDEGQGQDELLERAVELILETGQASASMLQRRFRIGYSRAGRLIDTMEEMRIIGPSLGSKPREIIMNSEQIKNTFFNK